MSGGRSSQRLIEEICAFAPHRDLVSLPPVQLLSTDREPARSRPVMAIAAVPRDGKPDPAAPLLAGDGKSTLHGFFPDSGWHVALAISPPAPTGTTDYDWHITDKTTDFDGELLTEYKCSLTGSQLILRFWPPQLEPAHWQMFEPGPIMFRFSNRLPAYVGATPPTSEACMETLYSIIRNSLVQDPPRPIPFTSARASVHIDMDLLDEKLGFTKNDEEELYMPPIFSTDEAALQYRGLLTEVAAAALRRGGTKTFNAQWPVHEVPLTDALHQFLGCWPAVTPQLSSKFFGALGATAGFSDDAVWERYLLQARQDPKNTPHYLESLKVIAQNRSSEELQMRVMELISVGTQTLGAIEDAFDALDLDINGVESDDAVVSAFLHRFDSALLTDALREDLAGKLGAIGDYRQSLELQRLAAAINLNYDAALAALGADETTSTQGLLERVDARARAGLVAGYEGRSALRVIGLHRQDAELLSRYEELAPPEPCTSAEGYSRLGVSPTMEDKDILAVFEVRAQEESRQLLSLRQALRAVGTSRQSELIDNYLCCRTEMEPSEPANDGPVGLWNIGNTCYLNSLLQYYFTIDPLRELVTNFGAGDAQQDDASMRSKTVGGRQVPYAEVERSQQFVRALGGLFSEMEATQDRFVVPAEDLAYMALVPPEEDVAAAAAAADEERAEVRRLAAEAAEERRLAAEAAGEQAVAAVATNHDEVETELLDDVSSSSASSFSEMEVEDSGDTSDVRIYDRSLQVSSEQLEMRVDVESVYSGPSLDKPVRDLRTALQRQQDVTECIENVLFQVEAAVKATGTGADGEQLDLIKDLFYGTTLQTLQGTAANGERRTKSELFSTLMVDVADGPRDIYSALDNYFGHEVLSLAEGETVRTVTAKTLPPILQVQIQRVQFDRKTGQPYKSLAPLLFDDVVYLDRYLDTDSPDILRRRAELRRLRAELDGVLAEMDAVAGSLPNGQTLEETLETCIDWLEQQGLAESDETVQHLFARRNRLAEATDRLDGRRKNLQTLIDNQFADLKQHGYKIYALFIHRGQVSFGHYWVYIRDCASDKFFKYNDEIVTEVPYDEVVDTSPSNTATPYFLVFVREDFLSNLSSRSASESSEATAPPAPLPAAKPREIEIVDLTTSQEYL